MRWHAERRSRIISPASPGAPSSPGRAASLPVGTSYHGMNQPTIAAHSRRREGLLLQRDCTDFRRHVFRYAGIATSSSSACGWAPTSPPRAEAPRPAGRARALSHLVNRPFVWDLVRRKIDPIMQGFKKNGRSRARSRTWSHSSPTPTTIPRTAPTKARSGGCRRSRSRSWWRKTAGTSRCTSSAVRPVRTLRDAGPSQVADRRAGGVRAARLFLAARGARLLRPCREGHRQRLRQAAGGALVPRRCGGQRTVMGRRRRFSAAAVAHAHVIPPPPTSPATARCKSSRRPKQRATGWRRRRFRAWCRARTR